MFTPRTSVRSAVFAATIAAALVACAGDRAAVPGVVYRDSVGITIVENAASARAMARGAWRVSREPVLSIGAVDAADPALLFGRVPAATRLGNGSIVVLDAGTTELRWFDATGAHLATRGGRGRGPGEFTWIAQLIRLAGDTVLAQNAPGIKQVLYAPSAELVREESLDMDRYRGLGRRAECQGLTLPDRSLVGCMVEPGLPGDQDEPRPGPVRSYSRYVRVPWTLNAIHPLGLYGGLEQWGLDVGGGRVAFAVHPFHASTVAAAGGDPVRIAIARNPEYSIELWWPDGRPDRIVRRHAARHVPTRRQRDAAWEEVRSFGLRDDALFRRVRAEMPEPDSIPAVQGLAFGPNGDLWVTRGVLLASTASTVVDIFTRDGEFVGHLELPARFRLLEVGEDYLLGARHDENDVPFVELYSLTRQQRGG